jgi:penicillin amidase
MLNRIRRMPEGERNARITEALAEATAEAGSRRWGDIHRAIFEHPLDPAWDLPAVARGGDGTTPNATSFDANFRQISGASFREILDLANWDRSRASNVPGQSGVPGSPHYGDLLPLWAEKKYFPLLYSRAAVEKASKEWLLLVPSQ